MQSADPPDCAVTGERCAWKPARTVRRGADGKGPRLRYLAGGLPYFTYPRQCNPADRSRGTPIVVMETTQHGEGNHASWVHPFAVHRC